jgi:protein-S-isoprenylcysteine O-methyltransferase Ste14
MKNSKAKMWSGLVIFFVFFALALFLSAGTIHYWQAWAYLGVGAASGVLLKLSIIRDPVLLESRTKGGPTAEGRPIQKIIVLCTGLAYIASFIVPGFDRRFGWSRMPAWLSVIGNFLIIVSIWMVYRVFEENSFASSIIEIGKDQKVISTGPYAIVRNPMYASAAVYFVGMPLALGSYWGLVPSVLTIFGLVWRLFDEEKFLAQNPVGYTEYNAKVRLYLVPGIF